MDMTSMNLSRCGRVAMLPLTLVAGPAWATATTAPAIALSDAYAAPAAVPSELALMIWVPLVGLTLLCALGLLWGLWLGLPPQQRAKASLASAAPVGPNARIAASRRATMTLRQLARRRTRHPNRGVRIDRRPCVLR